MKTLLALLLLIPSLSWGLTFKDGKQVNSSTNSIKDGKQINASSVEEVIKEIKKNKDIAQGFDEVENFEKLGTWNNWVSGKVMLKSNKSKREHVLKIVNKSDIHPVRFGSQSLRFEVRAGDAWGWDAENDRERVELHICCVNRKTTWTSWSLYLPDDHKIIYPISVIMGQFHNKDDNPPAFTFRNQSWYTKEGGGYWMEVDEYIGGNNIGNKLLDKSQMHGKWNDILVNAKWTDKDNGFFKIWINGKLFFKHFGKTQDKNELMAFHVGIYRSKISRIPGPDATQIAYYDEIRHANSCKKLKLNDLGYSCKEIEAQN